MMGQRWGRGGCGAALAAALGLAACGPANEKARVTINYEQVADFQSYRLSSDSNDSHGAGDDGLFVMYRILKIDNSGPAATKFVFDGHHLVLITDAGTTNESTSADNILLGAQLASPITVEAGKVMSPPKGIGCVLKLARAKDPKTLVGKMIDPIHQIDQSQPVTMSRTPGNNTEAAVIEALPSSLQNLCNTK